MAINLTDAQRDAAFCRDRSLIVSAAAGAGKTAVLVNRVVGLICDETSPRDIDRLLVVTYTNAAAAEVRGRISAAIAERLRSGGADRRLRRQLALIGDSNIQTVHAFCQQLIRRNFVQAGVAPDFTLLDENESDRLKESAMETLLESEYSAKSKAFAALCDNLCEERGDARLARAVRDIYERLRSHPYPDSWLEYMIRIKPKTPENTGWGAYALRRAEELIIYAGDVARAARERLKEYPDVEIKYAPTIELCIDFEQRMRCALERSWNAAWNELKGFSKPDFAQVRGADKQFTASIRQARDIFFDCVTQVREGCILGSKKTVMTQERGMRPHVRELCRLVRRFTLEYKAEKDAANALDFSDLEHIALGLLRDSAGRKTALANELSLHFQEVLVDEYQDTSRIQELIFSSVGGGSEFFVGDVKQSIYRFRLADPDIFIDRYMSSVPIDEDGRMARIDLSENFRSGAEVIDLCNYIFTHVMSRKMGDIDYDGKQRLYHAREGIGGGGPCEAWLIEGEGLSADDDADSRVEHEARLAAARIVHLLETASVPEAGALRRARPEDFAVLLSSFKGRAPIFAQELARAGVPVGGDGQNDFFSALEVSVLLSLLRIIDNRRQDIPLVSVLRSPLFFMRPDKLAEIRLTRKDCDFYDAMLLAAEGGDGECAAFIGTLDRWARCACDLTVAGLLRIIFAETDAPGIFAALDGGEKRRRNLEKLHKLAFDFEKDSARGLFAFLTRVDSMAERGQAPGGETSDGGVRLMSIHKSKGLEFPFVVIPDLGKRFNTDDARGPVLFHQDLGIGLRLRDSANMTERRTQAYCSVSSGILREGMSEEMRKLYVALTRARERLILIMSESKLGKKLDKWTQEAGWPISPEFLARQGRAMPWVCTALVRHPAAAPWRALCESEVQPDGDGDGLTCHVIDWRDIKGARWTRGTSAGDSAGLAEAACGPDMIGRDYAHRAASALPSKLTPAGVREMLQDAGEIEGTLGGASIRMWHDRKLEAHSAREAARRGTAIHSYIAHMDFAADGADAVRRDILRVCMAGHLTPEQAEGIDAAVITRLAGSALGARARMALDVRREYRFGAMFTPDELTGNGITDERILLNGAIDMILFSEDGMEIVDFKSDTVEAGRESEAAEKHRLQLELYAKSAERIFGGSVRRKTVYFLRTGGEAAL